MQAVQELQHTYIGTEHILLGLLGEHEGLAAQALTNLGVSREAAYQLVLSIVGQGGNTREGTSLIPRTTGREGVVILFLAGIAVLAAVFYLLAQ